MRKKMFFVGCLVLSVFMSSCMLNSFFGGIRQPSQHEVSRRDMKIANEELAKQNKLPSEKDGLKTEVNESAKVSATDANTSNDINANELGESIGIGPVKTTLKLEPVEAKRAENGHDIFESKCTACHDLGRVYVGPDLNGVTKRRRPEWIINMIMNPMEMTEKDKDARALLMKHMTQMPYQNVSMPEALLILEFFRFNDNK